MSGLDLTATSTCGALAARGQVLSYVGMAHRKTMARGNEQCEEPASHVGRHTAHTIGMMGVTWTDHPTFFRCKGCEVRLNPSLAEHVSLNVHRDHPWASGTFEYEEVLLCVSCGTADNIRRIAGDKRPAPQRAPTKTTPKRTYAADCTTALAVAYEDMPEGCDPTRWKAVVDVVFADNHEPNVSPAGQDVARDLLTVAPLVRAYAVARFVHRYSHEDAVRDACDRTGFDPTDSACTRYLVTYDRAD